MMSNKEKKFTPLLRCPHCNNSAPMEIVAEYSQVGPQFYEEANGFIDEGDIYELLICPACGEVTLRKYYYAIYMDPGDERPVVLYPHPEKVPTALPSTVMTAYQAANKVRSIDPNAYAVLLGRVLEIICQDRKAEGDTLYKKLEDLTKRGEIPQPLVEMAHGLRQLRNVGAHASLGELTSKEIPFLDDLCRAILEYVYSAPELIEKAKRRLDEIKGGKGST
jgi:hypothetical protein